MGQLKPGLELVWYDCSGKQSAKLVTGLSIGIHDSRPMAESWRLMKNASGALTTRSTLVDLARGIHSRFTFDTASQRVAAAWSPDGKEDRLFRGTRERHRRMVHLREGRDFRGRPVLVARLDRTGEQDCTGSGRPMANICCTR